MLIGGGKRSNYPALLLFLAGGALSVPAIYDAAKGAGHYIVLPAAAILLMVAGCVLVMARVERE
jgi:hypothetical protein